MPICCAAKAKLVGARVESSACPVPLRLTVCDVPEKLPEMERVPVSGPRMDGVNATLIVQESPGEKVVTQLFV